MTYKTDEIWEDKWVNTTCGVCYCGCAAKVRVVNGVPVKVEGIKDSTMGGDGAGLCGKGAAGLMYYHDPNRIKKPDILAKAPAITVFGIIGKKGQQVWTGFLDEKNHGR